MDTNQNSSQKYIPKSEPPQTAGRPQSASVAWLLLAGTVATPSLLNGCSSAPVGAASDPGYYNVNTGSPVVGGPPFHL